MVAGVEKTIADAATVISLSSVIAHSLQQGGEGGRGKQVSVTGERPKQQRREWKTQAQGETVTYEADLAPTYALRSTLPHAVLLHQILRGTALGTELLQNAPDGRRGGSPSELGLVFLSGGSGAELLALVHLLIQLRTKDHLNDSQSAIHGASGEEGPALKKAKVSVDNNLLVRILVADYAESWRAVIERYERAMQEVWGDGLRRAGVVLQVDFMQADLLTKEGVDRVLVACSGAHLTTLLYTITELYEKDLPATAEFLQRVLLSLQPGAKLLVADPVSNEICHDKTLFLDTLTSPVSWLEVVDRTTRKIS